MFPFFDTPCVPEISKLLLWLEQSAKNAKDEMAKKREEEIQSRLESDKTDGKNSVDGKQNADKYGKKEGVLRGLYHITGR